MTQTRKQYKKIAIIGFTEHKRLAPYADPEWEIWGLNDLYLDLPGLNVDRTRWFQLHPFANLKAPAGDPPDIIFNPSEGPPNPRDPNHLAWMRDAAARGVPLYLWREQPEVPGAIPFPRAEVEDYCGTDYFTNSISWMIGLALMELAPKNRQGRRVPVEGAELCVCGVDMMVQGGPGSEYGWQRPSCEYFLGMAAALGIGGPFAHPGRGWEQYVPHESDLCKTAFVYGDEHGTMWRDKIKHLRTQLSGRRGALHNQLSQAQQGIAELSGAIGQLDQLAANWMPGDSGALVGKTPAPDAHKFATHGAPVPGGAPSDGVPPQIAHQIQAMQEELQRREMMIRELSAKLQPVAVEEEGEG